MKFQRGKQLIQSLTPLIVSIVTVLIYVDTHSLHPILAIYARKLGASIFLAGVVVASYSIFEDFFELVFGYLMDKWRHKKVFIFFGLLGDALVMLFYSFSVSPLMLLGARIFHGVSGAVAGPGIMSLTSEIPHPLAKLGAKMGLYGTTLILASLLGWVFGGVVSQKLGYQAFFSILFFLLLFGALLSILIEEPEPLFPEMANSSLGLKDFFYRLREVIREQGVVVSCGGIFSHMITMGAITTLLPLRFEEVGLTPFHVGMTLATYGVVALFFQIPMGYFSEKYGRGLTLLCGFIIVTISMVALSFVESFFWYLIVGAIYGAGYSFLFPTLSSMVIENSPPDKRATASSLFHVAFTQGVVVGAFLFSWAAELFGVSWGMRLSAGVTLLFLLILMGLKEKLDVRN